MNFTFKKKWEILVFVLLGVAFVGFFLFFYFNGTASAPTAGRRDALILFFTFMVVTIWGVLILYRLQDRTVWFFYLGILLLTQIWLSRA
jgi:drug/metabolite transporter (DMT)-like permease